MSALGSADLQNSTGGNLASQTDQPGGRNVLPPLYKKLGVDERLILSCKDFLQSVDDFFKHKNITPLSQLTATPPFPTPHVLAQFASKAYTDYKTGEIDAQYETRLALPEGWKLLTTASNITKTNGYFGAAYWHPEHQQVVVAHRGTKPTSIGALWTDLKGVVLNDYVRQMESASTFAHEVVEVLREVRRKYRVSFQLFFTGHSLGGWLAQVTTFTTEYLKREGTFFLRSNDDCDYHPHTVVFDSPGCKDMLTKMTDKLDVRHDGRSIDIEHLDITSYLSAPNRINTCNKHVGTLHRIFLNLSDMDWLKKNSPLYNLKTHSMKKIVEVFDPKTGQVYKDEQGLLKLQVVVDWPVSTGLKGGEEYNSFFEWAKHLNNYHPNAQDESFRLSHCNPIRYQTKHYDDRVNSFRIFSEEEQKFLQCYRWLRHWAELCKPKELFSVMEDNEAQVEAEKILQNFEIKNDKIHCRDSSALQALIPYVKRLLQLFPEIKEKTERALSSDKVRNRVYQFETRRYVERISQSPLEFKSNALSFREFLASVQQNVLNLQMVGEDEWTGLIKVYQVLQNNGYLIEGQYTILKLEHLLTLNQLMDLSTLMQSTVTPYLLLMACEDNQNLVEEKKDVIRTLFDTIKQKPNIKIIFITRSGGSTVDFLYYMGKKISGNRFVTSVEKLTWSDLTTSSQEKLLEKSVKFQGAKISLNQLMSAESPAEIFPHLGALLEEKELMIADPVPISNGYNEFYYIGRTLRHQKAIKKDIFNDENVRVSDVYLARTEEEYTKFCQLHPTSKIHWLEKDKSGKFLWQQSQGSLETVRRYIDTESSHRYTADDLDKLLEQAEQQRVMLISDTAGMGKSTVLTHVSKQIKQMFPAKWVVRIDLNDHTDTLKALREEQIHKENVIAIVSERLLKLKPGLEMVLFKQCCEHIQKVRTVIMLDGFDEISPNYEETVIVLLQALRQTAVEQLWATTRPHLRNELEDKLQQLSYTLEPFSEENQIEFLKKFWSLRDWFTEPENKDEEVEKNKLQIYAKHLIKKLANSISDKDRELTGIPLQTHMLAEAFDEKVKIFYMSAESIPELPFKLELLELYKQFIERKYDIYQEEKLQVSLSKVAAIEQRKRDLKIMEEDLHLLALKALFTEEQVAFFKNNGQCTFSVEQLTRIGIVQVSHDGKLQFIHRTFAEYCVADYLVNRLTEWKKNSEQVQTFILKDILLELNYKVIRVFIDGLLSRSNPSDEVLKQCGSRIHDLRNDCVLIFHRAVVECNVNIVEKFLDSLKAAEHTDSLVQLLLAKDDLERTVLHMAAVFGGLEVLEKIWVSANEKLTKELNNKLLLAEDDEGRNVFLTAVNWNRLKILQKVWEWANEKLTREEINNKLLLATDKEGRSVFYMAAVFGGLEILEKIWAWAKEKLTQEDIKNKLLLVTDDEGRNIFHIAANWSRPKILQKIWECAKENLREKINEKILLATDNKGRTILHMAAGRGELEILEKIWEWAKKELTDEEIHNNLLLATDDLGRTVLHMAAVFGGPEIIQKVRAWANDKLTTVEINNKLLLATDYKGRTAFHMAADHGILEILQRLWEWANEKITAEEINNKLLLVTDVEGRTVFHMAAKYGALEKFEKIWDWANKTLTREEINNKLLLARDNKGRTVLLMAAGKSRLEILEKVWGWANKELTIEEINNKLLLATDNKGRTVFHMAVKYGTLEKLEKIWDWANKKLTREEINNKVLLARDNKGRTVLLMAEGRGRLEILEKVWEWANEKLTREG